MNFWSYEKKVRPMQETWMLSEEANPKLSFGAFLNAHQGLHLLQVVLYQVVTYWDLQMCVTGCNITSKF